MSSETFGYETTGSPVRRPNLGSDETDVRSRNLYVGGVNIYDLLNQNAPETSFATFEAICGVEVLVGDIVSIIAPGRIVGKTNPVFSGSPVPAVGIVEKKSSPTEATVRVLGLIKGEGFEPGKVHYVGLDSRPTRIMPEPPAGESSFLQSVGVAIDSTTLSVSVDQNLHILGE